MGIITTNFLCNISNNAGAYTSTQGYTIGEGNSQVVIGLNDNDGKGCFLKYKNNGTFQTSKKGLSLGHGNGCTYNNGNYYVTLGYKDVPSYMIYRYNSDFKQNGEYRCIGDNDTPINVSSITHIGYEDYILGSGTKIYVATKFGAELSNGWGRGGFRVYKTINLEDDKVDKAFSGYTLMPQSIYYDIADKKLYRVVSYKKGNEKIKKNGIAKYSLSGGPSYSVATFEALYTDERLDLEKYEFEAMSSDSNGQKYVTANAEYLDGKTKKDCDAIFKITL